MQKSYLESARRSVGEHNETHQSYLNDAELPGEPRPGLAEEIGRMAGTDFAGARRALAQAAANAAAAMLDPDWERPETDGNRDPSSFAQAINLLGQAAESAMDPGPDRPQLPEAEIAAWATAKDTYRRAQGISQTMVKEAKGPHQIGPYRAAYCANAVIRELITNAAAAAWLDHKDRAREILTSAAPLAAAVRELVAAEDAAHEARKLP